MAIRRYEPAAVITFGEDGLYWHLDHVGVHERTTTAVRSLGAAAPAALLRHDAARRDAGDRRRGARRGDGRRRRRASGAWCPTRSASTPSRRRWSSTSPTGCRASSRPFAAIAARWDRTSVRPDRRRRRRGAGWASSTSTARRQSCRAAVLDADRALGSVELRIDAYAASRRSTSCGARTAAAGSSWSTSMYHRADGDEITTASSAATAASFRSSTAFRCCTCSRPPSRPASAGRGRTAGRWRCGPWSASTTTRRPSGSRRPPRRTRRPTATSSRRSARTSRAATFSIASPIRPTSSPHAVVRAVAGTVLARQPARRRYLRRIGPSDPLAAGSVVAARRCSRICTSRRSGWRAASPRPAASRCAATATRRFRSRAARSATRCARTRSSTSGPSGSSSARWRVWSIDGAGEPGAVVINHTHNQLTWSPSHGQPLSPAGYRDLFETHRAADLRRSGLFADVVEGGPLDLSRRDPETALDADPALTIVATRHRGRVSGRIRSHAPVRHARGVPGQPALQRRPRTATGCDLRLQFPVRRLRGRIRRLPQYLPERHDRPAGAAALAAGWHRPADRGCSSRRRVIVDLPERSLSSVGCAIVETAVATALSH